ncbi:MAG: nuclear transport factor 2 family protein [Thermodesulfobacteriota bacterium]
MRLPSFFFLLLSLFVLSCGSPQNEGIEAQLSIREEAIETKNVDLYMTLISPDYSVEENNNVIGREAVKKKFLSNVALFDELEITNANRSIYERGDITEVVQLTVVDALVDDTKNRFKVNEKIQFAKIDGKWLIVKESDADFLERFVFGGSN